MFALKTSMRLSHGGQAVKPRKSGMPWMPWMPYPVWFTLVKQRRQGHISHQGEKMHISQEMHILCAWTKQCMTYYSMPCTSICIYTYVNCVSESNHKYHTHIICLYMIIAIMIIFIIIIIYISHKTYFYPKSPSDPRVPYIPLKAPGTAMTDTLDIRDPDVPWCSYHVLPRL
jgi:hypothetical protein